MCMEDIRLGRASSSGIFPDTAGGASAVVPANGRRIRLVFSTSGVQPVRVCPKRGMLSSGVPNCSIYFTATQPLVLRVEDIGQGICDPWFYDAMGTGQTVSVWETELDKE